MSKKRDEDHQSREKRFLELPQYPGGKTAFQNFIRENLKYPDDALKAGIEGHVHLQYWVDGNGKVIDAEVTHSLGYGCDEEALRLVRMLKYGKVKNRGVKVKASMRTRIQFSLPKKPAINYEYKSAGEPAAAKTEGRSDKKQGESFTWSIKISPSDIN